MCLRLFCIEELLPCFLKRKRIDQDNFRKKLAYFDRYPPYIHKSYTKHHSTDSVQKKLVDSFAIGINDHFSPSSVVIDIFRKC